MTPLATLLARIGWSAPQLARRLGVSRSTVDRWHSGRNTRGNPVSAPPEVVAYLARVAAAIERERVPR